MGAPLRVGSWDKDRWVFTIRGDMGGGVNAKLLEQLDKITDIEITFDVTYFTPSSRREKIEEEVE